MFGRRVMICQPTTGRTKEEILEDRISTLERPWMITDMLCTFSTNTKDMNT